MGVKIVDNTAFLVIKRSLYKNKEGIRRGLLAVAPEIKREVRRLIRDPNKSGRIYNIGGKMHQASAPSEAPANLSGRLAKKVGSKVPNATRLIIGDNAPYGGYLEYGTTHILPRPHLRPAALSKVREVGQAIVLGVKNELGKK
jgi:hypothetical protein